MAGSGAKILQRVASWPQEDVDELEDYARMIEARRTGVYAMSDEERAAVIEGWKQARRGQFVPDEEMEEFWKRCGLR
jgi:hypothetical protein